MAVLMLGVVAAVALGAAPGADKAAALARAKQWDELYLAFAAAQPSGAPSADRAKIARALTAGCVALQGEDPVMAFSLGERATAFEATAEALYCAGLTGRRADQRQAAEEAFRAGLSKFPRDGRFGLELGRLYLEDLQPGEAAEALGRVPPRSAQAGEARALLARAEQALSGPGAPERPPAGPGSGGPGLSYESAEDGEGRRLRQNQYFRFRYFNARRDFGQRAEYEGAVQEALEQARATVRRLLGVARERPVDVILYSREEFSLHHGAQTAQAVAGFYSEDAIRMNDSAELSDRTQSTLVHEYVHAVMDELLSFEGRAVPTWLHEGLAELIEWRAQGGDGPPLGLAAELRQLASQGRLPGLAALSQGPLVGLQSPRVAYGTSAVAVKVLLERGSMSELLELLRECGRGMPFPQALERRFGLTPGRLDGEVSSSLGGR